MQFYAVFSSHIYRYYNMRQVNVENTNVLIVSIERNKPIFNHSGSYKVLQFQSVIYNISNSVNRTKSFIDLESQLNNIFRNKLNYFSSWDTYIINFICDITTLVLFMITFQDWKRHAFAELDTLYKVSFKFLQTIIS